jgi:hypothetical protein
MPLGLAVKHVKTQILIVLFGLISVVPAQSTAETWQGLHFGMTTDEAKAALKTKGIAAEESTAGLMGTYELNTDLKFPLVMSFTLKFANKTLSGVRVVLNQDMSRYAGFLNSRSALAEESHSQIFSMMQKYGQPVSQKGSCQNFHAAIKSIENCEATWRDGGQLISYFLSYSSLISKDLMILSIEYKPTSSAL